ncbi:hypothetical protein GYMLUDRAFT_45027 [Collybiopsis luxurians FD-317 M1]|uniref:Uncharacterized protein n=1 Tax=Collybiopsis luxurians FD-317 M1 TaxID=944289 RepID=A0A0D0C977_9AGAR|nr:hypothetical protein GYMLUDRAFT_45027 [Collybiopsis luxurians FD-317 M1]
MANKQDPFRSQNWGSVTHLSSCSCSIDHIGRRTKNPSEYRCIALKFSQASSVRFSPIAFKGSSLSSPRTRCAALTFLMMLDTRWTASSGTAQILRPLGPS